MNERIERTEAGRLRQPVVYVPHGGGPWPFVDLGGFMPARDVAALREYFVTLPEKLPAPPEPLLVVSAHWEAAVPTVMTSPHPPLYYDYGGFPPEAYTLTWPAPGNPALAERVVQLLGQADIPTATDARRGFDHGTFVPFKLSWPDADVPTIQLSLKKGLDPREHLAIGRALAPLRDEGVLILGSGMSYHNMRDFGTTTAQRASVVFDAWLKDAATAEPATRARQLADWASAPSARHAHPREEHLIPLMVVAGAAGNDAGRITFNEEVMSARVSAVQYG
jgi:aromatic ring-opening dioxygenase catalytic subunit (LigB family)